MTFFAVNRNVVAPVTDDLGNGLVGVQIALQLIEVSDLQIRPELDGASLQGFFTLKTTN